MANPGGAPTTEGADFMTEVQAGLSQDPKCLPCKYFYDEEGSEIFDRICETPEYYPTRTELSIMREHVGDMALALGKNTLMIEPGSGSSTKIRILLDAMDCPAGYVPVEISGDYLGKVVEGLRESYPGLEISPVVADFTHPFSIPKTATQPARSALYFPGSTIGNFTKDAAAQLLRQMALMVGVGGMLLIGVDLQKDRKVLTAAYNDSEGVTASFNLNVLEHINRELGGDFAKDAFRHIAIWNEEEGRIEMHLVSQADQTVNLGGQQFHFAKDERIITEHSHKYTLDGFADLAGKAGYEVRRVWTDKRSYFSIQLLEVVE